MSCMVPVNSTVASERAWEALLRRREEKMALTPIKLVGHHIPRRGQHSVDSECMLMLVFAASVTLSSVQHILLDGSNLQLNLRPGGAALNLCHIDCPELPAQLVAMT